MQTIERAKEPDLEPVMRAEQGGLTVDDTQHSGRIRPAGHFIVWAAMGVLSLGIGIGCDRAEDISDANSFGKRDASIRGINSRAAAAQKQHRIRITLGDANHCTSPDEVRIDTQFAGEVRSRSMSLAALQPGRTRTLNNARALFPREFTDLTALTLSKIGSTDGACFSRIAVDRYTGGAWRQIWSHDQPFTIDSDGTTRAGIRFTDVSVRYYRDSPRLNSDTYIKVRTCSLAENAHAGTTNSLAVELRHDGLVERLNLPARSASGPSFTPGRWAQFRFPSYVRPQRIQSLRLSKGGNDGWCASEVILSVGNPAGDHEKLLHRKDNFWLSNASPKTYGFRNTDICPYQDPTCSDFMINHQGERMDAIVGYNEVTVRSMTGSRANAWHASQDEAQGRYSYRSSGRPLHRDACANRPGSVGNCDVRVVSINVYCPGRHNTFPHIARFVNDLDPDIAAFQEADGRDCQVRSDGLETERGTVSPFQHPNEYAAYSAQRGNVDYETNPILYRRSRFRLDAAESGWVTFNYSRARNSEGRRAVVWVRLLDNVTGRGFYVYNTHLTAHHNTASEYAARNAQAGEVASLIRNRQYPDEPVILMGDLNAQPYTGQREPVAWGQYARDYATKIIQDGSNLAMVNSPKWSTTEEDGDGDDKIIDERRTLDYIFTDADAYYYRLYDTGRSGSGRLSDHSPVYARISLQRPATRLDLPDWEKDVAGLPATYKVWVKTASEDRSGTNASIALKVAATNGELSPTTLSSSGNLHERYGYDLHTPNWPNRGILRRIQLRNTYSNPDYAGWKVDWIFVKKTVGTGFERRTYQYRFGHHAGDGWDGWLARSENNGMLSRNLCLEADGAGTGPDQEGNGRCGLAYNSSF